MTNEAKCCTTPHGSSHRSKRLLSHVDPLFYHRHRSNTDIGHAAASRSLVRLCGASVISVSAGGGHWTGRAEEECRPSGDEYPENSTRLRDALSSTLLLPATITPAVVIPAVVIVQ